MHAFNLPIYRVPNLKYDRYAVYTNSPVRGPQRAHGAPQIRFAFDSQLDMIAQELGLDTVEVMLRNARHKGDVLPNGDRLYSCGLSECIHQAAEALGWREKRSKPGTGRWRRGIGISACSMFSGAPFYPFASKAAVQLHEDGGATLFTGTVEMGQGAEIIISPDRPTVIIGDRIKPSGNSQLAESLGREDVVLVRKEAIAQVQEGAEVIEVSVGGAGVDGKKVFPLAVQAVAGAVTMPICIDTTDPELAAALEVCSGKPLVNSITGEERSLKEFLPLVKQRGAAVIGLARDEEGIPEGIENRVEMARHVLRQSISAGIPREDVILAPLPLAVGDDSSAGMTVLETIARLERIEKVNVTLRVKATSHLASLSRMRLMKY